MILKKIHDRIQNGLAVFVLGVILRRKAMKKKPKQSSVHSPFICDTCKCEACVFHIGDIKIPCANLKRSNR